MEFRRVLFRSGRRADFAISVGRGAGDALGRDAGGQGGAVAAARQLGGCHRRRGDAGAVSERLAGAVRRALPPAAPGVDGRGYASKWKRGGASYRYGGGGAGAAEARGRRLARSTGRRGGGQEGRKRAARG